PAPIGRIPGRQGFHETEPEAGFAWLRADGPAHVVFEAPATNARIRLEFYCVTADYPIDRILLRLNGSHVPHQAQWREPNWCLLETPPPSQPGVNDLALAPPAFLSLRARQADTPDHRYLSVALAKMTFIG